MGMMPFNMNPMQMVQGFIQRNPNFANNPQAQQYLQVIMSGDSKKGEELARNICNSFGVTPEQGVQQAQEFFKNNQKMFGGG